MELQQDNNIEEEWEEILQKMKTEYCTSNISYTTWIEPLTIYEVKDDTVFIFVSLKASIGHSMTNICFLSVSALQKSPEKNIR